MGGGGWSDQEETGMQEYLGYKCNCGALATVRGRRRVCHSADCTRTRCVSVRLTLVRRKTPSTKIKLLLRKETENSRNFSEIRECVLNSSEGVRSVL
jgi:hypothetical protein